MILTTRLSHPVSHPQVAVAAADYTFLGTRLTTIKVANPSPSSLVRTSRPHTRPGS
jgi:hypothetical protein